MPSTINIIEPTLATEAGHCYSFVTALCRNGSAGQSIRLWANRKAQLDFTGMPVELCRHFYRSLRRFQAYFLYRRLLRGGERIFVSTAGHTDLLLIDRAAGSPLPPRRAYLYVHWFNLNERKRASLRALAKRQPQLEIYGPTPTVVKVFEEAGFARARVVPYPISQRAVAADAPAQPFRHLLFAGAARQDKGFSHVVDLVAHLHALGAAIPVVVQSSSEKEGKVDPVVQADLQRLEKIGYPHLRMQPATLTTAQYAALYEGAICLQLYDAAAFADRISGVTLDAFSAGSPIIASAGCWIARMAERFDAGIAVAAPNVELVYAAVQRQLADYGAYQARARAAGAALQQENSAATLFGLLTKDDDGQ